MGRCWCLSPSRIIVLVIVAFYVVGGLLLGGQQFAGLLLIFSMLPVLFIWFSDEAGNYDGPAYGMRAGWINRSPGPLLKVLAWVWLLLPVIGTSIVFLSGSK